MKEGPDNPNTEHKSFGLVVLEEGVEPSWPVKAAGF